MFRFDYVESITSTTKRCTRDDFLRIVSSQDVATLIHGYRLGNPECKKRLPAFCWHASFRDGQRKNRNAVPSGLYILDLDHIDDPTAVAASLTARKDLRASGVVLLHITPSGKGLRLVARLDAPLVAGLDIPQAQRKLAAFLRLENVDFCTKDLARLSFAPQKEDVLYMDEALWEETPEALPPVDAPQAAPQTLPGMEAAGPTAETEEAKPDLYKGIPLKSIFMRWFELHGGLPEEGERNARFYAAARSFRYICDFDADRIARNMPEVGLPASEVAALCRSACESTRAATIPRDLTAIVQAGIDDDEPTEPEVEETEDDLFNVLPSPFREVAALMPPDFREASVFSLLPILGTLTTDVKAEYLDRRMHRTSFLTVITADQASGKSFARNLVSFFLRPIREQDECQRAIEMAYLQERRAARNMKEQPVDPRAVIRIIPVSVSIAKLLQRLDYAGGKHLFSFAEEMDSLLKSNRAGAWADKNDIYRNAFDNAEYGQDFMSDNSYSAIVEVAYNLLILGTPNQVARFFTNIENGMASRFVVCTLPDQFGKPLPTFDSPNASTRQYLEKCIASLSTATGTRDLTWVNERLALWLEAKRLESVQSLDRARDIFRRRAAVIGFRAALIAVCAYAPVSMRTLKIRERISDFAVWVADHVLKVQTERFGEQIRANHKTENRNRKRTSLYDELPETFTKDDYTRLAAKSFIKTPFKNIAYLWKKTGLIKQFSIDTYQKIKQDEKTD